MDRAARPSRRSAAGWWRTAGGRKMTQNLQNIPRDRVQTRAKSRKVSQIRANLRSGRGSGLSHWRRSMAREWLGRRFVMGWGEAGVPGAGDPGRSRPWGVRLQKQSNANALRHAMTRKPRQLTCHWVLVTQCPGRGGIATSDAQPWPRRCVRTCRFVGVPTRSFPVSRIVHQTTPASACFP